MIKINLFTNCLEPFIFFLVLTPLPTLSFFLLFSYNICMTITHKYLSVYLVQQILCILYAPTISLEAYRYSSIKISSSIMNRYWIANHLPYVVSSIDSECCRLAYALSFFFFHCYDLSLLIPLSLFVSISISLSPFSTVFSLPFWECVEVCRSVYTFLF